MESFARSVTTRHSFWLAISCRWTLTKIIFVDNITVHGSGSDGGDGIMDSSNARLSDWLSTWWFVVGAVVVIGFGRE